MQKNFNIIITGVGGQGLITLTRVLAEAALIEGHDAKTSELHGLSQRGGSVETHIVFGKDVFSPLVKKGGADLIISLEAQEVLNALYYGSKNRTWFLIDKFLKPISGNQKELSIKEIIRETERFSKESFLISASEITKKELGNPVLAGTFLLGYAVRKKIIPLKPDSILKAITKVIPEKYLALNQKAFDLSFGR